MAKNNNRSNSVPPALVRRKRPTYAQLNKYQLPNILPEPEYHLYVILLRTTGQFYIGATKDPEKRKASHFNVISLIIEENKSRMLSEWRLGESDDPQFKKSKRHPACHNCFAQAIFPYTAGLYWPGKKLDEFFEFKVIATAMTADEIEYIEMCAIQLAKDSYPKACLNSQSYSCYTSTLKYE